MIFTDVGSEINSVPNFYPIHFDHQSPWEGKLVLGTESNRGSFSSQKILGYIDHHFRLHESSCCNGKNKDLGKRKEEKSNHQE